MMSIQISNILLPIAVVKNVIYMQSFLLESGLPHLRFNNRNQLHVSSHSPHRDRRPALSEVARMEIALWKPNRAAEAATYKLFSLGVSKKKIIHERERDAWICGQCNIRKHLLQGWDLPLPSMMVLHTSICHQPSKDSSQARRRWTGLLPADF